MSKRFFIFILSLSSFFLSVYGQIQPILEKEITEGWEFRMVGEKDWHPAKVPGTIVGNLMNLEDVSNRKHPYHGDNEKLYQWVAERDWEFRTYVHIDKKHLTKRARIDIEFESLDLFAEVYINGLRWTHENAFRPLRCYDILHSENIEIRVLFNSTLEKLRQIQSADSIKFPGGERVYARKPQYEFGWDWGPRFV